MDDLLQLETLYESERVTVSRARDEKKDKTYIIKSLNVNRNNFAEISRLKYEHEVATMYPYAGVVRCLGFESTSDGHRLVYEDVYGQQLIDYWNSSSRSIDLFLTIAIKVTECLVELHKYGIIHRDINPTNILIHREALQVYLIDLEFASMLQTGEQAQIQPESLEGTLAYISPEQTGRMNRNTDSRADLYSLGITFYELLTGKVPFQGKDPLELVHAHIAISPLSPQELNSKIPSAISDLILKLISKNPEERYISAEGLKDDLLLAKDLLTKNKTIDFIPGSREQSSVFSIPQKLYGREAEVDFLLEAFDSISAISKINEEPFEARPTRLVLIGGYSGVGKTALINEIHKPILKKRGYFLNGKFDQFKRNIPYYSLIQAFSQIINQILTEPEDSIANWRDLIRTKCEPNLSLILQILPGLVHLSGDGEEVSSLPAKEAQDRFHSTLRSFISVFAKDTHPLSIFLDDLQWADLPTIEFLEYILNHDPIPHLLVIGAYRENEVDPLHPVSNLIQSLEAADCKILKLTLAPLEEPFIEQMISETIDRKDSFELSQLVYEKTGGNPYFVRQFLETLYHDGHIYYSDAKKWEYNTEEIIGRDYSENVVEILAKRLGLLEREVQHILKVASCIGSRFDIKTLSLAINQSPASTAQSLLIASMKGVIIPLHDAYKILQTLDLNIENNNLNAKFKFSHDRVQQAANSLLSDDEKNSTHVNIGEALYTSFNSELLEENLFEVINHLNHGIANFPESFGKDVLLLNYKAGEKAMVSFAYEVAYSYFSIANDYYSTYFEPDEEFLFDIQYKLSVSQFHVGKLEDSEKGLLNLLKTAATSHQQLLVYSQLVVVQTSLGKLSDVVSICSSVMQLFDVKMSLSPTRREIFLNYKRVQAKVFEKDQHQLLSMKELEDEKVKIAMDILMNSAGAAYWQNPEFGVMCSLILVELSYEHGNSYQSAFGYSIFGVALLGFGQYDQAYKFGKLALELNERYQQPAALVKVPLVFAFSINNWKNNSRQSAEILLNTFNSYSHLNDTVFLGSTLTNAVIIDLTNGENYKALQINCEKYLDYFKKSRLSDQFYWTYQILSFARRYQGLDPQWRNFSGDLLSESDYIIELDKIQSKVGVHVYYTFKMQECYLHGDIEKANQMGLAAVQYRPFVIGMLHSSNELFFYTLTLIWLVSTGKLEDQHKEKKHTEIKKNIQQFELWATINSANFSHRYNFLYGAYAEQQGDKWQAMISYEIAFDLSVKHNNITDAGFFAERIGDFFISENLGTKAKKSYQESLFYYDLCGAEALSEQLIQKNSEMNLSAGIYSLTGIGKSSREKSDKTISNQTHSSLDIQTILKANQALSGEIYLEGLVERLLSIALENAGATRGILLSNDKGNLIVDAEGQYSGEKKIIHLRKPLQDYSKIPQTIVNYTMRTSDILILDEVSKDRRYGHDEYFKSHNIFSVICMPIITKQRHLGYIYLENDIVKGAFSKDRLDTLSSITAQAAISIENARLYSTLEAKVIAQTAKLTRIQNLSQKVQNTSDLQQMRANLKAILYAEFEIEIFNLYVTDSKREKLICHSLETNIEIPGDVRTLIEENDLSLKDPLSVHRTVVSRGKSFFIHKLPNKKLSIGEKLNRDLLAMRSFFIIPLIMDNAVYGTLSFGDIKYQSKERIRHLTKNERNDLELLGQYVSSALYQALQKEEIILAKKEAEQAHNAAIRAKNEAAINQLAAHLAHEVNNPLNYIATGKTILSESFYNYDQLIMGVLTGDDEESNVFKAELDRLKEKFAKGLEQSNEGQDRIAKVIAEIRAITGVDGLNFANFDIVPIINEELVYSLHRNKVKIFEQAIKVTGTDSPIPVLSNQYILARSIRTVISNCIHFARKHKGDEGELYIDCNQKGNMLYVNIGNNSYSIKNAEIDDLFDLEKSQSYGTEQIGLAMIKELLYKVNSNLVLADHGKESGRVEFQLQIPLES